MDKIAVLIPCYNEEKTIEKVVRDWKKELPEEFGAEKVAYYFAPVQANSVMFEMDMNEVFALLEQDRKSTRLNSSHITRSRMPSSA